MGIWEDTWRGVEDIGKAYAKAKQAEEEQKDKRPKSKSKRPPTPNWQSFYSNKFMKYIPPIPDGPDIEDIAAAWIKARSDRAKVKDWKERESEGYMAGPIGDPMGGPRKTQLSPAEEAEFVATFKDYATKNKINDNPDDPLHYYDYRGAWKAGKMPKKEGEHWLDTWKLPGHETFSNESMYYKPGMYAGRWTGEKHDQYVPIGPNGQDLPSPMNLPQAIDRAPYMQEPPPEDIYGVSSYDQEEYPEIGYPMEQGPLNSQYGGEDMTNTEGANTLRTTSAIPRDLMGGPVLQPRWSTAANTAWKPSQKQPNWTWLV